MLKGAITALITPMQDNGQIDFISLHNVVEQQIQSGISGLVVAGTTGEAALLDEVELLKLIEAVIIINAKRVKIIVGVSSASTKFSCDHIQRVLNKIEGIDYLLALTPYYIKPTQDGLFDYYHQIAAISDKPIILYNVPGRTGCDLYNDTIIKLSKSNKNIVALKDATGEIERVVYLRKHLSKEFMLYSGDDESALMFILNGGDGVISVVSNLLPKIFSQMCNLALQANLSTNAKNQAIEIDQGIKDLYGLLFVESNPIPIKFALFASGLIKSPFLRSPLTVLRLENQIKLKTHLSKINLD